MTDLSQISAAALGRLYLAGATDPVAATEFFFDRIGACPDQAVFLLLTEARARREAEASLKRYRAGRPLGPLDGVPIAWKDLVDLEGAVTTAGAEVLRNAPPAKADAPIARHLAAAGMISLGKVNLSEFAYSGLGLNPHYGTPLNPFDAVPRAPGGSSSGSAVAVARGLAPCAIGSDTGGSVRIPAAFNGLVGLKTTEGRIDKSGVFPLSQTLDTIGPLARTVEDCILLDAALRGAVATDVRRAELSGLRLVVPENIVFDHAEDGVVANFERALAALTAAGATVERRHIAIFDEALAVGAAHGSLTAAEAYAFHRELMEGPDAVRVDPRITSRISGGKRMTAGDLLAIQAMRRRLTPALVAELDGALLAFPTVPHAAPEIAPLEADVELYHQTNLRSLRNTMLGNILTTCGLALPTGLDGRGLPTSLLLSAPAGDESRLLAIGLAAEAAGIDQRG
ncbi:amidase [Inquilinus sp. YAF38]|uniref:amidase n=1 Tax=Inquilinus sp. YAF38 TaxID=3233084 RepID=UPI003F8FFD83